MENDYDSWNEIKKSINSQHRNDCINVGEFWWANIGLNIGSEQNGTGNNYERPVLIVKRLSKNTVLVFPLTTKINQSNTLFEIDSDNFVILNQVKTIDIKRLSRQLKNIKLSRRKFKGILSAFIFMLKNRNRPDHVM